MSTTHARLTELFGEAIELTTDARASLLARVRSDDPCMADELTALLDADRAGMRGLETGRLGHVPDSQQDTAVDAPRSRRASLAPTIPGYRVRGVLGKGGMGTVYEAEQEAPRRVVAIKVLSTTSEAALARFHTEIEVMARLDHPGIAKIFEAGYAGGHPYFVMERVEGAMLDAHAPTLSRRERLALFAAMCDAVHHAHVKGVFHRDLKPSNVMVRPDGRVAILDFGIARVAEGDGDTRAGELVGTPLYMSPEQARLRAHAVDARSDVYTLGVMLYELLAGTLPYDVRGKGLPELALAICNDPPRPLVHHDRSLRGDLDAICDRALQKAPEQRYASAAALAEDVRRHLDGARVSVRVPGTVEQMRRFVRRRPAVAAAGVLGVAGAVAVTVLWLEARAARRTADESLSRVVAAHAVLEQRTNQLLLDQARRALSTDPTHAVALLKQLTASGVDVSAAWDIADEALGRGVAVDVRHAHDDQAHWIEPTPGGFVTAGYDGRVRLWTNDDVSELAQGHGRAHLVRPAPDGTLFALSFDGGEARIVDASGHVIVTPAPLHGDVKRVAWSPSGAQAAFADDRGTVLVWDRASGKNRIIEDLHVSIESLAWTTDGVALVVGADDGIVWRWDAPSGVTHRIDAGAEVLAVWGQADQVAALVSDGRLLRWQVAGDRLTVAGEVASGISGKTGAFSLDGTRAMLGGSDGRLAYFSPDGVTALPPHSRQVRTIALSHDGLRGATGSDDGTIYVWDVAKPRMVTLRGHSQRVRHLELSADGSELLSADSAGDVRRWRIDRISPTVFEPPGGIARIAVATDGSFAVAASPGGELRRLSLATGAQVEIGQHPGLVALDARTTVATADPTAALWWKAPNTRVADVASIHAVAVSPDDRWIAVATGAGPIEVVPRDGGQVIELAGHPGGSEAIAFSPDGTLLVSGGQDRVVRAWSPQRSSDAVELGSIDDDTRHVVFARGGALVATAGDDGKVRLWNVRGGTVDRASARIVASHHGAVIALASDGADRLVSVGRDHERIEIDLASGQIDRRVIEQAAQPTEGGTQTVRGVRLPIAGGRDVEVSVDGAVLVVHDRVARDFAALRARLDQP